MKQGSLKSTQVVSPRFPRGKQVRGIPTRSGSGRVSGRSRAVAGVRFQWQLEAQETGSALANIQVHQQATVLSGATQSGRGTGYMKQRLIVTDERQLDTLLPHTRLPSCNCREREGERTD